MDLWKKSKNMETQLQPKAKKDPLTLRDNLKSFIELWE
jgi:hypothetical protein